MSKTDILNEVKAIITPIISGTYVYPDDYATIPKEGVPICIVQEQRSVNNTTNLQASLLGVHSWNVEILVLVARGGRVRYPSEKSAEQDVLANEYEQTLLTTLIGAKFSDSINNENFISNIGWYQWDNTRNKNEGVYAVQILMNVQQLIEFV